jgi:hypothetical protein
MLLLLFCKNARRRGKEARIFFLERKKQRTFGTLGFFYG